MDLFEVLDQVRELLQQRGRVTYRMLQAQFKLDADSLEALREELIEGQELAVDKDGKVLVWVGDGEVPALSSSPAPQLHTQAPASYTPQHLAERILAEQAAMESRGSANGERKTITALFADLKGSTALIEGLDPEDARAIIDPALQLMMDAVHRYDGYVAQALGDGIFALFGAPIAHEDHPQRALYAALRMQEEMRAYSDRSRLKGGIPLQMRVGINTGEVVVRSIQKDDLHTDYVPVGHSTNLAARMEQIATPGSIVISEYTRKLTEGYFELKALGAAEVRGVEEPLNVYEVLGAGPLRTKLQVAARRGLSRFVGRQSELAHMSQALEQAKAGHGQIVGVMGEPGLGKSRLFYEFKLTSQSGCLVLEAFSVPYGKASPYLPIIELLKSYFDITLEDDERKRREKVGGKVLMLDRSLEETLPYLFSLLGIEDEQSSLHQMDAQIRRQRTFEALKKLFLRESLNQPLLLVFEDLHWIDSETQGFLDTLSDSVASANLLLLVNYRPEYRHEWGQKTYYTQLRLAPLGTAEAEELLTFLLGQDSSLTALKPLVLEKTEGTPFFMEEVVQTLAEEGTLIGQRGHYRLDTPPTELHISPTVQGVLAARIDRLTAEEKALLQQLAVIGRQFPVSLVKQVVLQPETELYRVLASLQAKEFLYEQPAFPDVEYLFKHALTQEVAYGTLLQEQRKALHERTGKAMEVLYQKNLEDHYAKLAHHYSRSSNPEKALAYLHLAGQQAVQRSANTEAIGYLTTAVEVLQTLPTTAELTQEELRLHLALGPPLQTTKGPAAIEVGRVYRRAWELCAQVGDSPHRFPTLWGLWWFHLARAEHQQAHATADQLMRLAEQAHEGALLLQAHHTLWTTSLFQGALVPAGEHARQGMTVYDAAQHYPQTFLYGGHDPGVCCRSFAACALWLLGYPDQAVQKSTESLALAQHLAHPHSRVVALHWAVLLQQWRREPHLVHAHTEVATQLATEERIGFWLRMTSVLQTWAVAEQNHWRDIESLQQSIRTARAQGDKIFVPYHLALLADGYGKCSQAKEGLQVLTEALAVAEKTGERFYEAELYRLKGELVLQSGVPSSESEAEQCFQQALAVARQQEAKSWELRAATSMARLWQQQGKTTAARDLLAPVYNWFTEGFDTADLKDAKSLLEELN